MSVDSARPEVTNTWTLLISALRSFLISVSVSVWPHSAMTSPVSGLTASTAMMRRCRALAALDGVHLVAEVDRRVRREDLDLVDFQSAEAVEHLFGQLVAFLDEQLRLVALELRARLLCLELRRVGVDCFTGERDVLGDDRAEDFALVGAALALLHEVELALAEEEAEDRRVRSVAECAQERGGRELLLLVDVDVDDVVDVDRELDPRSAERDDARRDQALAVRVRGLFEHHAGRAVQLAHDDALGAIDDEGAERREQRKLTEIDFLLDDVRALARFPSPRR